MPGPGLYLEVLGVYESGEIGRDMDFWKAMDIDPENEEEVFKVFPHRIVDAILESNYHRVETDLKNGVDPSGYSLTGKPLLFYALQKKVDVSIFFLLLLHGADPSAPTRLGPTIIDSLQYCREECHRFDTDEIGRCLLAVGGKIMSLEGLQEICLSKKSAENLELAIKNGSDITQISPLHIIADCGTVGMVDGFLKYYPDMLNDLYHGETALQLGIRQGQPAVAAKLIDEGIDLNPEGSLPGRSVLDDAFDAGREIIIKALLKRHEMKSEESQAELRSLIWRRRE
ncbi:hypothetical protein BO71DRAFT_465474 [Aspergillus ellipticus CBS 707.79]|uniref:Uncharacterized protein n=1 Tax=Aspergillus ellipticus CBS 707.79 TaxID=1448320 RepID=A0A319CVH1_9EURO|nr:hypothetical protein BO71DRAFT_465474 [Aspergillus ellipticus CBS 707.79]